MTKINSFKIQQKQKNTNKISVKYRNKIFDFSIAGHILEKGIVRIFQQKKRCIMKLIKRNIISNWKNCPGNTSQSFPGIAVAPNGRIIVNWRSAPEKIPMAGQHVLYSISDDGGESWSKPFDVFEPPLHDGRPGAFRAGYPSWINGRFCMVLCWVDNSIPDRPFFKEENSGLLDCKIFWAESNDYGETWSKPEYIGTEPFEKFSTPITGPLLSFSDGEMIAQFELNNAYDATEEWRHLPVLKFSEDQGRTFESHSVPASDPENHIFYWDQRPLVLKDDTLVDFFWTWDNASSSYFNIHMSYSADRGMNWSEALDTGIDGQPGQPVEFADGSLMLPYVDRTAKPAIKVKTSSDRGRTFCKDELEISLPIEDKQTDKQSDVNGAWNEMGKFSLGLPAGASSGHDTAYVVWYAGEDTDRTNIEFAEVAL